MSTEQECAAGSIISSGSSLGLCDSNSARFGRPLFQAKESLPAKRAANFDLVNILYSTYHGYFISLSQCFLAVVVCGKTPDDCSRLSHNIRAI